MAKNRCQRCAGSGYISTIGSRKCDYCIGLGRNLRSTLWSQPCMNPDCRNGMVTYATRERCHKCGGLGYIDD